MGGVADHDAVVGEGGRCHPSFVRPAAGAALNATCVNAVGIVGRVRVRIAEESDVPDLAWLRAEWREVPLTPDFAAEFRAWFSREQASRWWWLASADDEPAVGMINMKLFERMPSPERRASCWGYVGNLFVLPEYRGRGVGGQLIQAVVDKARDEGLARVVLSPSEKSVSFYRRYGFREADELLVRPGGG